MSLWIKRLLHKHYHSRSPRAKLAISLSGGSLLFLAFFIPFQNEFFHIFSSEKVSEATSKQEESIDDVQFYSHEVLIKVKKSAKGKVKENPKNTGIKTLDEQLPGRIKKFVKVAREGKKSKTDADIFQWYLVTLEGPSEKVYGKFDKTTKQLISDNPAGQALGQALQQLKQDPDIEAAEPNFVVTISQDATPTATLTPDPTSTTSPSPTPPSSLPNDPYYASTESWGQAYPDLWGMKKINMEEAWQQTTGSSSIIVADIDTGVDRNHEDLASNMWVNAAETQGNGIDDDGNGYVDDYYGWDWVSNDGDPMDDHGHGTHTAGTIAATGNNGIGVVGVNWTSKIMTLKFLSSGGSGSTANGIKALQYAADMGARVSSNSWGCACNSLAMDDAVKYEHDRGMVMVGAAGNSNADAIDFSPASAEYAVAVAASDPNYLKASFSNWGERIDVAAPGVDILSTKASVAPMCTTSNTVGTDYCRVSGASMATPHVAGLVALLLSKDPTLTNEEVRQLLRVNATDLGAAGKDRDFGYGRINAGATLTNSAAKPLTPIITSPRNRTLITTTQLQITGSAAGANFASYTVEVGKGRAPTTWTVIQTGTTPVTNGLLATWDTSQTQDGQYIIRLTTADTNGKSYQFQTYDATVDNTLNLPTSTPTYTPTPTPIPTNTPTPTPSFTPTPTPDVVGPNVTITSPVNGGTVPRNTTVTIAATASDPSGIARVEFRVNNSLLCTDTASPYTCNWKVPAKPNVQYTIQARGYDTLTNTTSTTITVRSN